MFCNPKGLKLCAVCVCALVCDPYEVLVILISPDTPCVSCVVMIERLDGAHDGIPSGEHGHSTLVYRSGSRPQPPEPGEWRSGGKAEVVYYSAAARLTV
jgi:hypothetical protein